MPREGGISPEKELDERLSRRRRVRFEKESGIWAEKLFLERSSVCRKGRFHVKVREPT